MPKWNWNYGKLKLKGNTHGCAFQHRGLHPPMQSENSVVLISIRFWKQRSSPPPSPSLLTLAPIPDLRQSAQKIFSIMSSQSFTSASNRGNRSCLCLFHWLLGPYYSYLVTLASINIWGGCIKSDTTSVLMFMRGLNLPKQKLMGRGQGCGDREGTGQRDQEGRREGKLWLGCEIIE